MRTWFTASVLACTAIVLVVAMGATAASSSTDTAVFKGAGTYHVRLVRDGGEAFDVSAAFKFRTVFLNGFFVRGVSGRQFSSIRNSTYGGTWKVSATLPGHHVVCSHSGTFAAPLDTSSPATLKYSWNGATVAFHIYALPSNRMASAAPRHDDCYGRLLPPGAKTTPPDFWRDWALSFSRLGGASHDVLSARFRLSAAALTSKQAIETLLPPTSTRPPAFCVTHPQKTCTQSYGWNGTVKFSRKP